MYSLLLRIAGKWVNGPYARDKGLGFGGNVYSVLSIQLDGVVGQSWVVCLPYYSIICFTNLHLGQHSSGTCRTALLIEAPQTRRSSAN